MFYLIRHTLNSCHGSLEYKKLILNKDDCGLTDVGKIQAYRIGEKLLQEIGLDKEIIVISSPYLRTLQTAENIRIGIKKTGLVSFKNDVYVEDILSELNDEKCVENGSSFENIHFFKEEKLIVNKIHHNELECFKDFPFVNEFPETEEQANNRFKNIINGIKEFIKEHKNVVPVLVTHGFFIRKSGQVFLNKNVNDYYYGSVNKFVIENDEVKLEYFNKKMH
jgi:broad specificity phosphatase PhoE